MSEQRQVPRGPNARRALPVGCRGDSAAQSAPSNTGPRSYRRGLGRIKLYLNDLDDLLEYLRRQCKAVSSQAGEATAENPDDLIEATPRELKSVIVTTSEPALRVNLLRRAADVSTTQTSAEARAMVDDVHGLLRRRRSPWPGLGRTLALPLVYAAIFLVIGVWNA